MDTSAVVTAIQGASTSLIGDSGPVIAAGIGVSVVFFGARLLWNKFRGMAK